MTNPTQLPVPRSLAAPRRLRRPGHSHPSAEDTTGASPPAPCTSVAEPDSACVSPLPDTAPAVAPAGDAASAAGVCTSSSSAAPPSTAWVRTLPDAAALRLRGTAELRANRALQRLPLAARTLVRLLRDIDSALAVVAAHGGTTVHIPAERSARALARHPLRALLTLEQMRRLVRYYAGTDVYIPRCLYMLLRVRDVQIVRQFDAAIASGVSAASVVRNLAREYRLSDRWIWHILKTTEL